MEQVPGDTHSVQLLIQLSGGQEIDDADLDSMARSLRSKLEVLPYVKEVAQQRDRGCSPTRGEKAGEIFTLGALALAVLPEAIPAMIAFIKEWVLRPGNRPVKIKTQGSGGSLEVEFDPRMLSPDEVNKLVSDMRALVDNKH